MSEDNKVYFGKVIWFSAQRGFGFIEWSNDNNEKQKDIFLHYSDIVCEGFKTLYAEQQVSFQIGTNKHGDPKAIEVTVIK